MKVDGGVGWDLDEVGAQAREMEEMGYSGILTAETGHDPFLHPVCLGRATGIVFRRNILDDPLSKPGGNQEFRCLLRSVHATVLKPTLH